MIFLFLFLLHKLNTKMQNEKQSNNKEYWLHCVTITIRLEANNLFNCRPCYASCQTGYQTTGDFIFRFSYVCEIINSTINLICLYIQEQFTEYTITHINSKVDDNMSEFWHLWFFVLMVYWKKWFIEMKFHARIQLTANSLFCANINAALVSKTYKIEP